MNRRELLRKSLLAAPAVVVASVASPFVLASDEVSAAMPEWKVGEDQMCLYSTSDDVNEFKITIDRDTKLIDIIALDSAKPHLTVLALHRYIQDLLDNAWSSDDLDLDIMMDNITSRSTDNIIHMLNDWEITPRGKLALYGSIEEGDWKYCGIRVLGAIDYRLTRNIRITDEHGNTFPYHEAGVSMVRVKEATQVTMSWESYKNIHYEWVDDTNVEPRYGVWLPESFTSHTYLGTTVFPIYSA